MTASLQRRWFQFTLSNVLMVVLSVSVFLGWLRSDHERWSARSQVLELLEEKKASVKWDQEMPVIKQIFQGPKVARIDIRKGSVTEEELDRVRTTFPEANVSER